MESKNTENKKGDKRKVISTAVLVTVLVVILGLSVCATIWLYQQGVDIKQFFIRPPMIQPIGLPNIR